MGKYHLEISWETDGTIFKGDFLSTDIGFIKAVPSSSHGRKIPISQPPRSRSPAATGDSPRDRLVGDSAASWAHGSRSGECPEGLQGLLGDGWRLAMPEMLKHLTKLDGFWIFRTH